MTSWRAITTAVLALLLLPGVAEAKPPWGSCGPDCARIRVPLDRSGALAGRVSLRVMRVDFAKRGSPHLMYLSGGPGGAGIAEMLSVVFAVPRLASRYEIIGFDQRGTGASGLLRCPALQRDGRLRSTAAAERCAQRIGPRRAFYTTRDTVADMEAIRRAVGARKLTLFGISYGTKLALEYARTYPHRVERLILDSVVAADEIDPFALASFRAMGPSLATLCPADCRGLTADPAADLVALTAKLRAAPLRGAWYDRRGRRHAGTLRPTAIADLLFDADYNPGLRAGMPMAVRAALAGDAAPMLRLLAAARFYAEPLPTREFSAGRFATICEETPLPWPRGTPLADRPAVARERALALPGSAFAPFDADVALDGLAICLRWPDPGQAPPAPGAPYPAVPALLLQGQEDVRTPPEVSQQVASLLPRAQRVVVPGVGHAVIGADLSGCGQRQLMRFVQDRPVRSRCPRVPTEVPPTAVPPLSFDAVAPVAGHEERVGRTIGAIDATLDFLDFAISPALDGATSGGGLRGGSYSFGRRVRLRGVVVVPGVVVSGRGFGSAGLELRVSGAAAAHGRVRVTGSGRMTGRLGGRRVSARLANRPPQPFGITARVAALRTVARAAAAWR
jgi:pimeloyl-ACP methyl ester carboxylesterase